jgi:hypothetical protein
VTDREVLEAAAKAAGVVVEWRESGELGALFVACAKPFEGEVVFRVWNPLADDGDALRLAVKLEMDVFIRAGRWSEAVVPMTTTIQEIHSDFADPFAATRRAIVRAAASVVVQREHLASALCRMADNAQALGLEY